MVGDRSHERTQAIHPRGHRGPLLPLRTLPTPRYQPQDWLQVGSSDTRPRDPTGCSNAPIGPIAVPTPLSPTSSRLPSSSAVIDPGGEQPRFSAGSSRCTPTGRYPRPRSCTDTSCARPSQQAAAPTQTLSSRSSHRALRCAQLHLVRRLQGAVQDPRRRLLLPAHRPGWLQPLPARLSGPRRDHLRRFQTRLHPPLPRVRHPRPHPHR